MTRGRAKEVFEAIKAWAEGKQIQVAHVGSEDWATYDTDGPNFDNENWKWRVKPEPRGWWVVVNLHGAFINNFSTKELAEKNADSIGMDLVKEIIKVQEVL